MQDIHQQLLAVQTMQSHRNLFKPFNGLLYIPIHLHWSVDKWMSSLSGPNFYEGKTKQTPESKLRLSVSAQRSSLGLIERGQATPRKLFMKKIS